MQASGWPDDGIRRLLDMRVRNQLVNSEELPLARDEAGFLFVMWVHQVEIRARIQVLRPGAVCLGVAA